MKKEPMFALDLKDSSPKIAADSFAKGVQESGGLYLEDFGLDFATFLGPESVQPIEDCHEKMPGIVKIAHNVGKAAKMLLWFMSLNQELGG